MITGNIPRLNWRAEVTRNQRRDAEGRHRQDQDRPIRHNGALFIFNYCVCT